MSLTLAVETQNLIYLLWKEEVMMSLASAPSSEIHLKASNLANPPGGSYPVDSQVQRFGTTAFLPALPQEFGAPAKSKHAKNTDEMLKS